MQQVSKSENWSFHTICPPTLYTGWHGLPCSQVRLLKNLNPCPPFYKTTLKLRFKKRSISNLTLSTFFQFKFLLYSKIKLKSALQDIQTFLFFDIIIHILMLKIKSNSRYICINQFLITFWSSTVFSCWTSHPEDSIKTFDF